MRSHITGFFPTLRAPLALGRNLNEDEDRAGAPLVAILAYDTWQSRFNGREDVLGQTLLLDAKPYTIIGVASEKFLFLPMVEAAAYLSAAANRPYTHNWGASWIQVIGRLKDGITPDEAQAELSTIAARIAEQQPQTHSGRDIQIFAGDKDVSDDVTAPFAILFGVVAFVLLIACVNVANLLLSKAAARQKEIAIRSALGASRVRIIRQLVTESILLATLGGGLGLLLSLWGMDIIIALLPAQNAQAYVEFFEFGMNADVFAFAAAASILTGLLFGLAPAIQASRPNLNESLKEGGAGAGLSRHRHRVLNALVVVEIALALVLLIGATLMVQSYNRMQHADPGFDPKNLLTTELEVTEAMYASDEEKIAFFRTLEDRIARIPGVEAVGASSVLPFSGTETRQAIAIEGAPDAEPGQFTAGGVRHITPDYFRALGVPLVSGRMLTWQDSNVNTGAAMVNEAFAKRYFPDVDPLGKRFMLGGKWGDSRFPPFTIVGVVKNIKHRDLTDPYFPEFYLPYAQIPLTELGFCIRSKQDPESLAMAVRQAVRELDPMQPLSSIDTMEQMIADSVWMGRFTTILFALFAGVALFLATIGVYGVINYSVVQQTHEIGVRLALGAQPSRVMTWVLKKGLILALLGLCLGLPAAYALTKQLQVLLYEISASDPVTFLAASVFLVVVAAVASIVPARRATGVDPIIALRYE